MVRASDLVVETGVTADEVTSPPVSTARPEGPVRVGGWVAAAALPAAAAQALSTTLADHHAAHPLQPGMEIGEVRAVLAAVPNPEDRTLHPLADPSAAEAVLAHLQGTGVVVADGARVRLPTHRASTAGRDDADRLVAAVAGAEPTPPTVRELVTAGFPAELIRATCADGRLVRVSPELVLTPGLLERAEEVVRSSGPAGVTVSAFREALGTTRKYAVPILEHFDTRGLTRRQGDVRTLKG
jgi:selenocysteine-specific elongation factor